MKGESWITMKLKPEEIGQKFKAEEIGQSPYNVVTLLMRENKELYESMEERAGEL